MGSLILTQVHQNMVSPVVLVAAAVIEYYFCTGLVFGWPTLSQIFINDGFFNCDNVTVAEGEPPCNQQLSLTMIFIRSSTAFSVTGFFAGMIYDKFGTTVARTIGNIGFFIGVGLIAIAEPGVSDNLIAIGTPIMAASGITLMTTNFQIANFFETKKGFVMNLFNGSIDSSSSAALILLTIYRALGYKTTWFMYGAIGFYLLARTLFLMPVSTVPSPLPEDYELETPLKKCSGSKKEIDAEFDLVPKGEEEEEEKISLKACLASPLYISCALFFIFNCFRVYFFLATMNFSTAEIIQQVNNVTHEEAKAEAAGMAAKFSVVQAMGLIFAPMNGYLVDTIIAKLGPEGKFKAIAASTFFTTLLGLIFSVTAIIPIVSLQYVTFLISAMHRAFTFANNAALIGIMYPHEYFGTLFGLCQLCTFLSSQAIGPMERLTEEIGFMQVNTYILFMMIGTSFHFVVCMIYDRRQKAGKSFLGQ